MTSSKLKANVLNHDPDSHYFDRKTMQFFGGTLRLAPGVKIIGTNKKTGRIEVMR